MQLAFAIDHHKCIGCHACTVACKSENDVPVGDFRTWVKYTEVGSFPAVKRHFAVLRCNHCTNAPCVTICPVTALHKRPDGIVDLDRDACIGCKSCLQACPYDALYLNEDTGGAEKCHFCAHRIEQNLEPACVVVCPERAILVGDAHDPEDTVGAIARAEGTLVRRPEQHTGPNVYYIGSHPVPLSPGSAAEPDTWIWSDRRLPPPPVAPAEEDLVPQARTVLNVDHPPVWGWRVSAYLVTKGIAGGTALLAPFLAVLGVPAGGYAARFYPELVALTFTLATVALLIADLKRPSKFFRLLTRPQTKSWLVKGGWILSGFGAVTTAILGARVLGFEALADSLRYGNAVLGALTAIYTAWLFGQCEGRDLWQNTKILLPHLLVQAVWMGAVTLLPFAPQGPLAPIAAVAAVLHLVFVLVDWRGGHETANARHAARLLPYIRCLGAPALVTTFALSLVTLATTHVAFQMLAVDSAAAMPLALLTAAAGIVGLGAWEHAYVRAGQLPPLS
jgi:Fe-S-cluster-containing dehydrogenase component